MKQSKQTKLVSLFTLLLWTASVSLHAAEHSKPQQHTKEFERMKTLVGTWKGEVDMGEGPVEMTVKYRVIAGGSVLEERIFPGTPNEMVTMYYDKDGKLALTHYCLMGNRPEMRMESSDAKTLTFAFDESCGIDPATENHMNALTIRFDDADTMTSVCKSYMNGQPVEGDPTVMKRVSAE